MQNVPSLPDAGDAAGLFDGGHLWIQEFVDGQPFRFQLGADALLQFGNAQHEFSGDDAPRSYRHAVHHVQRALDRNALRDAVEDTETVTFVGVATHRERVDYDWARLPSVFVTDIHDSDAGPTESNAGQFLPPARVEQVTERLGLAPVNALAKEVRATDFDPASYEFPDSAWRDGPVAGVVLRNKTGQRAMLENERVLDDAAAGTVDAPPEDTDAADVAAEYAPEPRYRRVARELEGKGQSLSFDAVQERVLDGIYREHAPRFCDGRPPVDLAAFEQAVAKRTSEFLADR